MASLFTQTASTLLPLATDAFAIEKNKESSRQSFATAATDPASFSSFRQSSVTTYASVQRSLLSSPDSESVKSGEKKTKKKFMTKDGKKIRLDEKGNPIKKQRKPPKEAEEPTPGFSMSAPKRPSSQKPPKSSAESDNQSVTLTQALNMSPQRNDCSSRHFSKDDNLDHSSVVSDITMETYEESTLRNKLSFIKKISVPSFAPIAEGKFENSRSSDPSNWSFANPDGPSGLFPRESFSSPSCSRPLTLNEATMQKATVQPHFQKTAPIASSRHGSSNHKKYPSTSRLPFPGDNFSPMSAQSYALNEETMRQASVQPHFQKTTTNLDHLPPSPMQSTQGGVKLARDSGVASLKNNPSLPSRTQSLNSWQTYESEAKMWGQGMFPRAPSEDKWEEMICVRESTSFSSSKGSSHVTHGEHVKSSKSKDRSNVGQAKRADMNSIDGDHDNDIGRDKWEDMNDFGVYNSSKDSGQAKWEDMSGFGSNHRRDAFNDDAKGGNHSGGSSDGHVRNVTIGVAATAKAAEPQRGKRESPGAGVGAMPKMSRIQDPESHDLLIMYLRSIGIDSNVAEDIALTFAATTHNAEANGDDESNLDALDEQIQTAKLDENCTGTTTRASAAPSFLVQEPPRRQNQRHPVNNGRWGRPGRSDAAHNPVRGSRTWTRARAPGAVQMDGRAFGAPRRPISNIGFDDENPPARSDDMAVNMTAPVEGHIVEATAVKDDASMPVVYAESSPLSMKHLWQEHSLRRLFLLSLTIVGIIIAVVAAVVSKGSRNGVSSGGSTASPSSSPTFILEDLLSTVGLVSGEEAVLTPGTPQRNAVGWLSSIDEVLQERSGPALLQRYAMVTLYYATQGDKWLVQESWLDPMLHECDWSTTSNIKCKTDSSGRRRVIGIDLTRAGLMGSIPKEIGQFESLEYLRISKNMIMGSFPSELFTLPKLNVLDANTNSFSGSLPAISAKDLAYLDLSFNTITGEAPLSMYDLSALRILDLSYNQISGTLPRSVINLKVLTKLNLRSNLLHSTIPADFEDLPTFDFINLDDNLLTGTLPYWVTGLVSLQELTLGNNLLSGSIPDINVADLDLSGDMRLKVVDVSRNHLNGTVPFWTGFITSLQKLDISRNQFSGTLSAGMGTWKSIEVFKAGKNRLTGIPPPYIPSTLNYLDLSDNQFSGPLSVGLFNSTNLKFVSLAGNLLGGAVAPLLESMTLIKMLDLSRCALTGTIPPGMKNIVGLETFYAENNFLNGTIPSELGTLSFLQTFRISNNSFVGTLPTEFGRLVEMTSLHVDGNELQGTIPEELVLLTDLESLKVNDNYFEPTFPSAICTIVGEISVSDVGCEFNCPCCTNRTLYCGDDVATGEAPGWNNVFVTPKGGEGRE